MELARGRVKSYNPHKGFGFINCPQLQRAGCSQDVYLSKTQAPEGLGVGQEVEFQLVMGAYGQPQARNVRHPAPATQQSESDVPDAAALEESFRALAS